MKVSIAGRSTVAGTSSRAIVSVYSTNTKGFRVREMGVFNTTSTAVAVGLTRFTTSTAVGAGLTEVVWDSSLDVAAPLATAYAGHTADSTGLTSTYIRQASLGAAIGSGIIWTFGGEGVVSATSTSNGVAVVCPTGTGQILDYYIDWEE